MEKIGRFDAVNLDDNQLYCVKEVNKAILDLESEIETFVINPRYRALALTELEKVSFWANKGISRRQENSDESGKK